MADPVAIVSIVSSAAVALGTIGVQWRTGIEQRRHEKSQDYEARVWDTKSKALYEVIAVCSRLSDVIESSLAEPGAWSRFGIAINCARAALVCDAQMGPVEAYSDRECRDALRAFVRAMRESRIDFFLGETVDSIRHLKSEAIEAGDFERAARMRHEEAQYGVMTEQDMVLDEAAVKMLADKVIDTARQSLGAA